jgi:hypothetical protein
LRGLDIQDGCLVDLESLQHHIDQFAGRLDVGLLEYELLQGGTIFQSISEVAVKNLYSKFGYSIAYNAVIIGYG